MTDRSPPTGPPSKVWGVPSRYHNATFGIFIHRGIYSVPAFGHEWYARQMYLPGHREHDHHRTTYGSQETFGYKDFIPKIIASAFDPNAWAQIFRSAGAKFTVPVAEHQDGFAMYATALSDWSAARMGPRRGLIGELASAVRNHGMTFGLSSHRAEHWWFYEGGWQAPSDVQDPRFAGRYGPAQPKTMPPDHAFLDDWLRRSCELVDRYEPQLFWFD